MALFVSQQSNRSKLQERLVAELNEKAKQKSGTGVGNRPDGVEDSSYMEGTKRTTSLAWVWILVGIAFVVAVIWVVTVAASKK